MGSILNDFEVKYKYFLTYVELRKSNINRITAFNCKFPLCMSIKMFLDIQIQRIFSLKNCPECKFTWNIKSSPFENS